MLGTTPKNTYLYSRLLVGKARQLIVRARQKELISYHLSPRQAVILTFIKSLGDKAYLSEIARHTERNINTLSIQMTRLVDDGLVKKIRDTPKSNKVRFELTKKGLNVYQNIKEIKSAKVIMSALSEEERRQLISLLERIINKAQKYN